MSMVDTALGAAVVVVPDEELLFLLFPQPVRDMARRMITATAVRVRMVSESNLTACCV
jgi:hypothetical protein